MLRAMRDGAKQGFLKFILLGFMALAVGGLVLTDVGGFFRGGLTSNIVAKGKNVEIGINEFDKTLRRILSAQQISPQEAYERGLINQALRSEIQNKILAHEATKIGLRPNDDTVANQIKRMTDNIPTNGGSKRDALVQILRSQGISENEFISAVREEIAVDLLQNSMAANIQELPIEQAKAMYQFQNETRNVKGFLLKAADEKGLENPTEEQLQKFYDARKINFAIPETRDITIATLTSDMIEKKIEITEDEVRDVYDDTIESYKKPEQRTLQQAVVKEQQQAQEIINALETEKTLEKAVLKITNNTTSYLGENKFSKTTLTENIAGPSFKAKKGEAVGPIESPLGWHIITVQDITPPQTTPFDSVKEDIRKNLKQERLIDDLVNAANTLDDQLASGEPLETAVAEMGLTTETFKSLTVGGMANGKDALAGYQGDKVQILETAFDFNIGEVSPVMEMADGRYIVVRIDAVEPLSYKPFSDVRGELEKDWMAQQRTLTNQARAEEVFAAVNTDDDFEKAQKDFNLSVKDFNGLKRGDATNKDLSFIALSQIFDADQDDVLKIQTKNGFLIGKVTKIELPDTQNADKEIEEIQKQNSQYLGQEIMGQYMISLLDKYKVRINDALLQQVYGTPAGQ